MRYKRNGTVNLFVFLDAHRSWRHVKVTDHRTARRLCPLHARSRRYALSRRGQYPRRAGQSFDPYRRCALRHFPARRRLIASSSAWSSITRQSTPVGSTWSRSKSACCAANVWTAASATAIVLVSEIAAWEQQRNASGARIEWMFYTQKARQNLPGPIQTPPKSHNHCDEVLEG